LDVLLNITDDHVEFDQTVFDSLLQSLLDFSVDFLDIVEPVELGVSFSAGE